MTVAPFEKNLLSVREFCVRNGISRAHFYNLVQRGDLRFVKVGGKTLIPIAVETDWLTAIGARAA
ncbi:MAG: excisionase family DNA-binding protein [Devosia sp.]|nr:excisionase family DNA-binding protein [Devosia sp.]